MSPDWRSKDCHGFVHGREENGSWNGHMFNGNSGPCLVLQALQWWRDLVVVAGDEKEEVNKWNCAADDVLWSLEKMSTFVE